MTDDNVNNASTALLLGSYRKQALGRAVAHFVSDVLLQDHGVHAAIIDAGALGVPFVAETYETYIAQNLTPPAPLQVVYATLAQVKRVLCVAGEYNHLPQPGLLNLIDSFYQTWQGKVAGLVTYSAGSLGGVRAENALRALVSTVGMRAVMPAVTIPHAHKVLDDRGHPKEPEAAARLRKNIAKLWAAF